MTRHTHRFPAAVAVLAMGFGASLAFAGDEEWTDISPPIAVTSFSTSGAVPGLIYAAGGAGVYMSDDHGQTWTSRNAGLTITEITAVAAAPTNPNRVVAAEASHQIVVSNNRGATWSAGPTSAVSRITKIVFHPDDDDIIFALDDGLGRVMKSTDGGATWVNHTAGLPANPGLGDNTDLVISPLDPDTLYVTTVDGVYRSDDAGASWTRAHGADLPSTQVIKLAEHPGEPHTVAGLFVAGSEIQFWRTNDRGVNWYRPGEDPEAKFRAQAVAVDIHDPSRLLLGGGNGVYGSVDAAHHWVDLNAGLAPTISPADRTVAVVAFDPHTTRRYYVATEGTLQVYDGMIAMDLIVTAAGTPAQVDDGETTTIAFAISNITGETASGIAFELVAPGAFTVGDYAFDAADCSFSGTTLTCAIASLAPGEKIEGTLSATAAGSDGLHDFTVKALPAEREATPASNEVVVSVRIGEAPPDTGGGSGGGSGGGGSGGGGSGGGGGGGSEPPPPPRPPSSGGGSGGGGNGGWLWLLGAGAALVKRRGR